MPGKPHCAPSRALDGSPRSMDIEVTPKKKRKNKAGQTMKAPSRGSSGLSKPPKRLGPLPIPSPLRAPIWPA